MKINSNNCPIQSVVSKSLFLRHIYVSMPFITNEMINESMKTKMGAIKTEINRQDVINEHYTIFANLNLL